MRVMVEDLHAALEKYNDQVGKEINKRDELYIGNEWGETPLTSIYVLKALTEFINEEIKQRIKNSNEMV